MDRPSGSVKACTRCSEAQPVDQFNRDKKRADGLSVWCRTCRSAARREARAADPEGERTKRRARRAANPDPYRASNKRDRERRRQAVREQQAEWRAANLDHARASSRAAALARQAETLPRARNYGKRWTGPELEVAARAELTSKDVALMLGRTEFAVETVRVRLRVEPKYARMAGLDADLADLARP